MNSPYGRALGLAILLALAACASGPDAAIDDLTARSWDGGGYSCECV